MKHRLKILISGHALIRYLERVKGIDMRAIEDEIAPQDTLKLVKAMGDGIYPVSGSHRIVVKNGTVITIYL